ncbi:hypothetical protein Patl1_29785 [Pistacia atlantica]|uniref:Uncharacterized protein n=1 Tax=Pistacia atlantica TaxID=434234 RepID=A0ACC1ACY5_9ROSI|nr:hypothetical protein Patl1_29785 [Pistacia atlantica]
MAANVYRKRSGSVTLKESRGESKSEEIAVGDDMTIGAMKDEIARKLAGGRPTGEVVAKPSNLGDTVQVIGGEALAETDPNSAPKGEQPLANECNSGQAKKEEEGTEKKSVMESDENCITLRRKRGADGEMILAYLQSQERGSPRLRPRQVPTFRMVDLGENDDHRIVEKRIKVYWPESRKWFTGHIKAFNANKGLHSILYDDGDKEELNLRKERFELEILPNEGFNLKADSSSKKKGRGLDGNEVSPLTLPETAFKVEDAKELMKSPVLNVKAKEVMTTPETKKENVSKKVGKFGSSKLQKKSTKVKQDSAAGMEKVDAKMEVDVKPGDEVKKSKSDADVNVEKAMEVNHQTDNEKAKALEEVGEKYAEGQITILALAAVKNKDGLEDGDVNGDMEGREKQAEPENTTASEDAVISSILSFRSMKDKMNDLSPTEKVEEEAIKEISAQGTSDVDMQQSQMESAPTLTIEIASAAVSKLLLPKNPEEGNPDHLPEDLKAEKRQPEEASRRGKKSASQKAVEGGKKTEGN